VGLRVANLDVGRRSPDEYVYTGQARAVLSGGIAGTRALVDQFVKTPSLWLYPPPTRVAYLFSLAAAMKVTSIADFAAGSYVSCLASVLALGWGIWLAVRFFGPRPAVPGAMFLAAFPSELAIARRCWSDAVVGLTGVAMLYCTLEIWNGRKRWPCIVLPVVGSAAILVKETTALLYASCLVASLWAAWSRDRRSAMLLLACTFLGGVAATALLAITTGSPIIAIQIMANQARQNALNEYALEYASGPAHLLWLALARMSPLTTVRATFGLLAGVLSPAMQTLGRFRPHLMLAWLTIANTAIYVVVPHWLNLRYASAMFVPLCLFAGLSADWLLEVVRARMPRRLWQGAAAVAVASIAITLAMDYRRFENNLAQLPDLSVKMVLDATAK
jgi:hypothetical protein